LFTLKMKPDGTLIFNKTGFARHEEAANNRSEIHVIMKTSDVDPSPQQDSPGDTMNPVDSSRVAEPQDISAVTTDSVNVNKQQPTQNVVQGSVTDRAEPISGVTVSVKGKPVTAATDDQGHFRINADADDI